ncbi:hypothetical protein [Paraburkholderia unamae]|uniref:Uncharacterized protein n=1 Tax=Paraburkholderia unamae TaxID=219649 RepID=A0ACC6RHA8_9BURK
MIEDIQHWAPTASAVLTGLSVTLAIAWHKRKKRKHRKEAEQQEMVPPTMPKKSVAERSAEYVEKNQIGLGERRVLLAFMMWTNEQQEACVGVHFDPECEQTKELGPDTLRAIADAMDRQYGKADAPYLH